MIHNNTIKVIDLTHTLTPNIPSWDGSCGFEQHIKLDYKDCTEETKFRVQNITMHAGIGTHMDAPSHCIPGGLTIADIPLEKLIVPCIVIDVSQKTHERYTISPEDIYQFERKHGIIASGSLVLFVTGWEKWWNKPDKYHNNYIFPCLDSQATHILLEREVFGIGIDTLSPDRPENNFIVHRIILGASKYIVENVANASQLPPVGSYCLVFPIKTEGATEAPVRMVGLVKK